MSVTSDRTETLFAAAVELQPGEREAFLDQECRDDKELRDRLNGLLQAHDRAHHLLDRRVDETRDQTVIQSPSEIGKVIAERYKLLEQIGEGGMGTVWVAEQFKPVRRKVAVKLVKAGMDSKSVLARFEAERQALALMDHPNIAKVLDGGLTDNGRPYFVMEYVKGISITEFCDATRLSISERLDLFLQVCSAVQHAHQKGIIHRDLKPSNVLVAPYDDKPVPKVIDFGLAKAMNQSLTEKTLHTAHEMVLGTPLYMSPEQAQLNNLDVDTRTDIYSLGVLLYELLTGTTPLEKARFQDAAWDEIRRLIREEEPQRPSTRLSSIGTLPSLAACRQTEPLRLTQQVRGELDWIVMKTLEKDRTRRYETATGLARDVQRYLTGEAVEACPPTLGYRLRKLFHRHRAAVTTVTSVAAVLILGTIFSTWMAVRATRAERAATAARLEALFNQENAENAANREAEQRRIAERAIDRILDMLELQTSETAADSLISQQMITPEQQTLYEIALQYFSELQELQGKDEADRPRIAAVALQLAKLEWRIGREAQAMDALSIALPVFSELVAEYPDEPEYQYQLADCHVCLGGLYRDRDFTTAVEHLQIAINLLDSLCEIDADHLEYRELLANCHIWLGIVFVESGRTAEADSEMNEALLLTEELAREHRNDSEYQYRLARALQAKSVSLGRTNRRSEEASELFERLFKISEALAMNVTESDPNRLKYQSLYSIVLHNKGRDCQEAGQVAVAEQTYRKGLDFCEQTIREFPGALDLRSLHGRFHVSLGITLAAEGKLAEARAELEEARDILQELTDRDDAPLAFFREAALADGCLGRLLRDMSDLDESVDQLTSAIETWGADMKQEYTFMMGIGSLPHYYGERAITYDWMKRYDDALKDWDAAIDFCRQDRPNDMPAYQVGRLATQIQSGEMTPEEAVWQAVADHLVDAPDETCLNRMYLFIRFFAIAAEHSEDSDQREEYANQAIDLLDTYVHRSGPCFVNLNPENVDFNVLRNYPRYDALMQEIAGWNEDEGADLPLN